MRDRVVERFKSAGGYDSAGVEPDEDDLRKMVEIGIRSECERVHSKDKSIDRRWTAVSEWRDVEIQRVGSNKLKVTFPTTTLSFTGGNPNDNSDRDGDTPTFEIEITRTDR